VSKQVDIKCDGILGRDFIIHGQIWSPYNRLRVHGPLRVNIQDTTAPRPILGYNTQALLADSGWCSRHCAVTVADNTVSCDSSVRALGAAIARGCWRHLVLQCIKGQAAIQQRKLL
jgi:hypothetical protein